MNVLRSVILSFAVAGSIVTLLVSECKAASVTYEFTASVIAGNADIPIDESVVGSLTVTDVGASPGGFGVNYNVVGSFISSNSLGNVAFTPGPNSGAATVNNDRNGTTDDFIGGVGGGIGSDILAWSFFLRDDQGTQLTSTLLPIGVFDLSLWERAQLVVFFELDNPLCSGVTASVCTTTASIDSLSGTVSAVPLPAALPLFLTMLAGMAGLRWWRRRTTEA